MFRKLITFFFPIFFISVTLTTVSYAEVLECTITHRLNAERLELQKKWMPDVTTHNIGEAIKRKTFINNKTYKSVIVGSNLDGQLGRVNRNYENNRIKLTYNLDVRKPNKVLLHFVYQQTKGHLTIYADIDTDHIRHIGTIAKGNCIASLPKSKSSDRKKGIDNKPGEDINSLIVNLTNEERKKLNPNLCGLKVKFYNVSTEEQTTSIFYSNENNNFEILNNDVKNIFYKNGPPEWKDLTLRIEIISGSKCKLQNTSEIKLKNHKNDLGVYIDSLGNVKIKSDRIKLKLLN